MRASFLIVAVNPVNEARAGVDQPDGALVDLRPHARPGIDAARCDGAQHTHGRLPAARSPVRPRQLKGTPHRRNPAEPDTGHRGGYL